MITLCIMCEGTKTWTPNVAFDYEHWIIIKMHALSSDICVVSVFVRIQSQTICFKAIVIIRNEVAPLVFAFVWFYVSMNSYKLGTECDSIEIGFFFSSNALQ